MLRAEKSALEVVSLDEYQEAYADKVSAEELADHPDAVYILMARANKVGSHAVRGYISFENFAVRPRSQGLMAQATMSVLNYDDFQPVGRHPSHLVHGLWMPAPDPRPLCLPNAEWNPLVRGYFLRHEDDFDIEFEMLMATPERELELTTGS